MKSPHRPSFDEFLRWADQAPCVPVYRQLTGDALTPVSAFAKIGRAAPSFLFESVIGGEKVGRFSFLGSEPFVRFEARGDQVKLTPASGDAPSQWNSADPFRDLEALLDHYRAVHMPGLPRFAGGAAGYAAYDAVRYTEHLPDGPPDDRGLP
jgi:anthranilate synthase component I